MMLKRVLPLFFIGLTLIAVILIGSSTQPDQDKNQIENLPNEGRVVLNCFIQLPERMLFAGEQVPLNQNEIMERLDRELNINTFWHSSTIQIIKLANRWFPVIEPILKKKRNVLMFSSLSSRSMISFWLRGTCSPAKSILSGN